MHKHMSTNTGHERDPVRPVQASRMSHEGRNVTLHYRYPVNPEHAYANACIKHGSAAKKRASPVLVPHSFCPLLIVNGTAGEAQ